MGYMKIKPDILVTLLLIVAKLTIATEMPWICIAIPFFVSVGIGFFEGFRQGLKDKNK